MTGTLFALSLILLGADDSPPPAVATSPDLSIDPCVAADEDTVRQVMDLEIPDAGLLPALVRVQCVDGGQEIRIARRGSADLESVRTIHIAPAFKDDTPAERQARSRELALAIAEIVRRPGLAAPPPAKNLPAPPLPTSPAVAPAQVVASSTEGAEPDRHWQVGLLYAIEHFSRGQRLMGADILVASRWGRWFMAELRLGGRLAGDQTPPGQRLTMRAAAVAAAAGLQRWSPSRVLGGALVVRAQGYLAQFHAEAAGESLVETANLAVLALALEPRLMVAVSPRFLLQASVAAGVVPRGIVVRIQGVESPSLSGVILSANLAGVFAF